MHCLLTELNEKFCVNLDNNPSFERSVPPPFTEHSAGRTVFIVASILGKIAKAAAEYGYMVVELTSGGWTPKPGKIKNLCETLEKLKLMESDTVVIDPMSNSAFLGTDEDGLPIPAKKFEEDGRYHLSGDLQLTHPLSAFRSCLKQMEKVVALVGGAKVVFIIPLPRYVLSACCKDTGHVSNRLSAEFATEFSRAEKSLAEAAAAGERTGSARLVNILNFYGTGESSPRDLPTVDGASIWAGDGVHLTSNACRVAARKLMADLTHGGHEDEPAAKRTRLESVIPVPAPARKKELEASKGQPTPPPRPCPPLLWLSGQLPPTQRGRGAGSQNPSNRGGGLAGGSQRGHRGQLRGSQRGRWGRW